MSFSYQDKTEITEFNSIKQTFWFLRISFIEKNSMKPKKSNQKATLNTNDSVWISIW